MVEQTSVELKSALQIHHDMTAYRDVQYLNMIQQINTRVKPVLSDNMGSQFLSNCGRDIAGEVVRNFFDTSDYNITVDQLAMRILKFTYEDEYDPLAENGKSENIKKSVYNYNEIQSAELDKIVADMDNCQSKLFPEDRATDRLDANGKEAYRESRRDADGNIYDELTHQQETRTTVTRNGKVFYKSDVHADHIQSREASRYNSKYITHDGVNALREFWNSSDNMQLMHASANTSKGDIRVCEIEGKVKYLTTNSKEYKDNPGCDITHRATPRQLTEATVQQWEKGDPNSPKIQKLIEKGYLQKDENGNITVPKSVQKALEHNIRHSQNVESKIILENTDYGEVAKDAAGHTKAAIGKIIAGQIIYYAAPPLVYEIKVLLSDKAAKLDSVLERLSKAATRIVNYVVSKLKDIFKNIVFNSLKKFIKSFMDILINAVKATVKKLLKIAKNLVLSTVDAIKIIASPNASAAEKADSVFNLFGVTITSCVIEVLFELAADTLHIPEPFDDIIFGPLQVLATVVCTNLTMLILQKADLFDVRFGFKINTVKKIFDEERTAYAQEMSRAELVAKNQIGEIIQMAKEESLRIYESLAELNPQSQPIRGQLENINRMFSMDINFDAEWLRFIGVDVVSPA